MSLHGPDYERRLVWRHFLGLMFEWACRLTTFLSLGILAVLLFSIGRQAIGWLDWGFLVRSNSYEPREAGIMAGLMGSLWLILLTAIMSVPLGVGAAVYLEEYAKPTRMTKFIQLNISNLAGVPSIVYGILGFTVFVRMFGLRDRPEEFILDLWFTEIRFFLPLGRIVLSGACTLTLLSLPVVIISAQEALRSVPASLRHASLALGATKWQTVRHQVLPAALPGILTGVILSLSRAIGETAPLAVLGAAAQLSFAPGRIESVGDAIQNPSKMLQAPFDQFTAIPLQIYGWINDPKPVFEHVAAAGIVVLLVVLMLLNGAAIFIRQRFQKKIRW
ncbi:MAG: phosphate ABC transporter permease PstA [Planctomycetes bacterium]|nr:phosphate ABC transporter permease PstA [Planctomycetota bacterium]